MSNYRTMRRLQEWEQPPSRPFNKDGTKAKPWTVVLWEDGSYSCNCPSWCKTAPDATGIRACKHIARVLLKRQAAPAAPAPRAVPVTVPLPSPADRPGKRRIILED